ncbi:hypothetical protein DICA3_D00298 [Diutina catenulata]
MDSQPLSKLPGAAALVSSALAILDDSAWSAEKPTPCPISLTTGTANTTIATRNVTLADDAWIKRTIDFSELSTAEREECYYKLVRYAVGSIGEVATDTTCEYEKEYVDNLESVEVRPCKLEGQDPETSRSYLTRKQFRFPFPFRHRVFYGLVYLERRGSRYIVVQAPIDPRVFDPTHPSSSVVVGRYASVGVVDLKDDKLTWDFCISPHPGGNIPDMMVKMSMPSAMTKEVQTFFSWVAKMP